MTGKIYFFGAKAAGKTQLINTITSSDFDLKYTHTSCSTPRSYRDVELWDISEEEIDNSSISQNSSVAVYCLDLSESLNEEQIVKDLENFRKTNKAAPIFLVGTKLDLERKISDDQFHQLLIKYEFIEGFKLSAKINETVSGFSAKLFERIREILSSDEQVKKNKETLTATSGFFSPPRVDGKWELSACQMTILLCIPVIGWAVLLAYLIYRSCLTVDEEPAQGLGCR